MRLDLDPTKVVRYPRALTLGAIQDAQLVYELGYEIARQCRVVGVDMNLAPVVDINTNKENLVIADRSFGDDPERVATLAQAYALGLRDGGILSCAKHFPGHGDTSVDSHYDLPVLRHTQQMLQKVELIPFKRLFECGVDAVMYAHLAIPLVDTSGTPSSLSYDVVTKLAQQELGFHGLHITDGLGMGAVTKKYAPGDLELIALLAGNDILLCPLEVPKAVELIEQAIQSGIISEADIDRRVLKIMQAKQWAHTHALRSATPDIDFLIRKEAYDLQERLYRAAVTLVPTHHNITFHKDLLVQSCVVSIGDLPDAVFTTLCQERGARRVKQYGAQLTALEYQECVDAAQQVDTVIVAVGSMTKFNHQQFGVSSTTVKLVQTLAALDKKVVVVLFGSPYSISLFYDAGTILVAYEDVPVAQRAVVDVLQAEYIPTGRLPIQL